MTIKKAEKVEIVSERVVHSYSEFWHTSCCLLEIQKEVKEGAFHLTIASLVFTAFTLEAYFNHIGSKLFNCWHDLEKLSPKQKLNVISEKLELDIDYSILPWQVVKDIFQFRNDIAHGKSHEIKSSTVEDLRKFNTNPNLWAYRAETKWEKYCTIENAISARKQVSEIVRIIHEAAKIEGEYPFQFGFESQQATVQNN